MISLSDLLARCVQEEPDCRKALELFSIRLEEETGTRVDFCRLHERRWAHYAGHPDPVIPEDRITIAPGWGVIVENNTFDRQAWENIGGRIELNTPSA